MDDDLQHPPEEAHKLFARLAEGFDVVYGAPEVERHGFWRDLTSRLIKKVLHKLMNIKSAATVSAFRLFRAEISQAFADYKGASVSIDVLLGWAQLLVTVEHEREHGNQTTAESQNHALTLITGFSNAAAACQPDRFYRHHLYILVLLVLIITSAGSLPGSVFASIISIFGCPAFR